MSDATQIGLSELAHTLRETIGRTGDGPLSPAAARAFAIVAAGADGRARAAAGLNLALGDPGTALCAVFACGQLKVAVAGAAWPDGLTAFAQAAAQSLTALPSHLTCPPAVIERVDALVLEAELKPTLALAGDLTRVGDSVADAAMACLAVAAVSGLRDEARALRERTLYDPYDER